MYEPIKYISESDYLVIYEDNLFEPTSKHKIDDLDYNWIAKHTGYQNLDWQVNKDLRVKVLQDYGNDYNNGDVSLNLVTQGIGLNNHSLAEKDGKLYLIFPNKPLYMEMVMICIGEGSFDLQELNWKRPFQINSYIRDGFVEFEITFRHCSVNGKRNETKVVCANKMFSKEYIFDAARLERALQTVWERNFHDRDLDYSSSYNCPIDFQGLNYVTEQKLIRAGFSYDAESKTFFKGDIKLQYDDPYVLLDGEWVYTMTELLEKLTLKNKQNSENNDV